MKEEEARRLANLCLPHFASDGQTIDRVLQVTTLCRLWSGKGFIYQVDIRLAPGGEERIIIVKHVTPSSLHSLGDRRKAASYHVEANFYESVAVQLHDEYHLRIAAPFYVERGHKGDFIICMSKLFGSSNLSPRFRTAGYQAALKWLATFHASYWGAKAEKLVKQVGLQPIGSYWYLDTRLDEHKAMPKHGWEGRLKRAARAIDMRLQRDPLQCLIHGDPKDENIMWEVPTGKSNKIINIDVQVSMYDFQYCGKGPPSRDVAYFLCCCDIVDTDEEAKLVDSYFEQLLTQLKSDPTVDPSKLPLKEQFSDSLDLAMCDFCRFMSGWGYWGADLSKRVQAVLQRLDEGRDLGSEEAYEVAVRREFG